MKATHASLCSIKPASKPWRLASCVCQVGEGESRSFSAYLCPAHAWVILGVHSLSNDRKIYSDKCLSAQPMYTRWDDSDVSSYFGYRLFFIWFNWGFLSWTSNWRTVYPLHSNCTSLPPLRNKIYVGLLFWWTFWWNNCWKSLCENDNMATFWVR